MAKTCTRVSSTIDGFPYSGLKTRWKFKTFCVGVTYQQYVEIFGDANGVVLGTNSNDRTVTIILPFGPHDAARGFAPCDEHGVGIYFKKRIMMATIPMKVIHRGELQVGMMIPKSHIALCCRQRVGRGGNRTMPAPSDNTTIFDSRLTPFDVESVEAPDNRDHNSFFGSRRSAPVDEVMQAQADKIIGDNDLGHMVPRPHGDCPWCQSRVVSGHTKCPGCQGKIVYTSTTLKRGPGEDWSKLPPPTCLADFGVHIFL